MLKRKLINVIIFFMTFCCFLGLLMLTPTDETVKKFAEPQNLSGLRGILVKISGEWNIAWIILTIIMLFIILVSKYFGGAKKNKVRLHLAAIIGVLCGLGPFMIIFHLLFKWGVSFSWALMPSGILYAFLACYTTGYFYELVVIGTGEAFGGILEKLEGS